MRGASPSQVIWYWQWPYAAIVEDDNTNSLLRFYDYSLMPYQLTNASSIAEADMVANLLHDVGVAVNMSYGCSGYGGSSASPSDIPPALQNIFGHYSSNLLSRSSYTDNQWISMMKNELNAYRPILYGGQNGSGGHRFVIDGYNSDNTFHINYGWGGNHNGNYSIDAIYNDYNQSQSMVMNIHPNYPSCSAITVPSSNVWNTHFVIQNGGGINVGNRTITNGMQGCIFSGDYVNLTQGFHVNAGAELYIDIKDMHCNNRENMTNPNKQNYSSFAPQKIKENNTITPTANIILREGQFILIRDGKMYNLQGQEIQ